MDGKTELTIAALIFLAGTAGLASGESIGGVETMNEGCCSVGDAKCGSGEDGQKELSVHDTLPPVISLSTGDDGKKLIDDHNLFVHDTLPPVISLGGYIPGNDYGDNVGIDEI